MVYNFSVIRSETSLLLSRGTSCLNLFHPLHTPQLHQHHHLRSACHPGNRIYQLTLMPKTLVKLVSHKNILDIFSFNVNHCLIIIISSEISLRSYVVKSWFIFPLHLISDHKLTRVVQPVATCRQSPYLHKPAIVIVTSFSL